MAEDASKYTMSQLSEVLPSEVKEIEVGINILPKSLMLLFEEGNSTVLRLSIPHSGSYAVGVANLIPPNLPSRHH